VLLGGGEFSFGETLVADRTWAERIPAEGAVGFIPAASDSADYGRHFAEYMKEAFGREVETIPIYRPRDARRARNAERIAEVDAVYLGGGVADHLLEALAGSPAEEALRRKFEAPGGLVVAIAAAAQATGEVVRSVFGGAAVPGLAWLPGGVVETNFEPAHDRRLRKMLEADGARWGLGIPAGSAVVFGPDEAVEISGTAFVLTGAEADLQPLQRTPALQVH
jgi:cyanophycinase-like exopeptidase